MTNKSLFISPITAFLAIILLEFKTEIIISFMLWSIILLLVTFDELIISSTFLLIIFEFSSIIF